MPHSFYIIAGISNYLVDIQFDISNPKQTSHSDNTLIFYNYMFII